MRTGKNRICKYCGQVIKPGGMGGHIRLKHGITEKTIVKHVRDIRGDVRSDVSGDVRDVSNDLSDVRGDLSHLSDVRERIQRPSDYVKKKSEKVVNERIEQGIPDWLPGTGWFKNPFPNGPYWIQKGPDSLGRYWCKNCGGWYMPDTIPPGYNCVPGKEHEFDR